MMPHNQRTDARPDAANPPSPRRPGARLAVCSLACLLATLAAPGCQSGRWWNRSSPTDNLPGAPIPEDSPPPEDEKLVELDDDLTWWERTIEEMSPERLGSRFRRMIGRGPSRAVAEQYLDEGDRLFVEARYREAAKRYKKAANRWPDSDVEEDALFRLGECRFFDDEYSRAAHAYGQILKKYENSRHLETITRRDFAIARYWEELGQTHPGWIPNLFDRERPFLDIDGEARELYEVVHQHGPKEDLADDSVMALANWHFVRDHYEDAAYNYDLLRRQYPSSEFQPQAYLLGTQANLRMYQGFQYDSGPLDRADELIEQTLAQFDRELAQERDGLLQARTWVREEKARRDWESAEYYYRTGYNRAARFYYDQVVTHHEGTQYAEKARQRLDETYGQRPYPRNYFKWLTAVFPKANRR